MRILNTKIRMSKECTRNGVITALYAYLANDMIWKDIPQLSSLQKDADFSGETGTRKLHMFRDRDVMIVSMQRTDLGSCTTNVIFRDNVDGLPMMGIQIDKEYAGGVQPDYEKAVIPKYIRSLLWKGYFGKDHGLPIQDHALLINNDNIELARRILSGEKFDLPVFYISTPREQRQTVNYEKLAYELAGIAHVVVESNPHVSAKLEQEFGEKKKPYNGAGRVYADGIEYLAVPSGQSDFPFFNGLKKVLLPYLANLYLGDALDAAKNRASILVKKLQGNQELSGIFDEILEEKDQEITQLQNALEEERQRSGKLRQRLIAVDSGAEAGGDAGTLIDCTETEFYPGEIRDVLLKELEKARNQYQGDPNLEERRNYHILNGILEGNKQTTTPEQIMESVRRAIGKDVHINKMDLGALEDLGFSVETGGSHIKFVYRQDPRYTFTMAKTSSDYRASDNIIKTIERTLF